MRFKNIKFHFIGVGGIGMCGLAELFHNSGAIVTGSDLSLNVNTEHLKKLGIGIFQGHDPSHVQEADVVVYSSAVKMNNPEMMEARQRKIPRIPRAEALAEIMRFKRGVAVAGTHGKTTTTSMAAAIYIHAQSEPTVVVGGRLDLIKSTAVLGNGEWIIAEADESDGSFSKLTPEIAIITNIDDDHMDFFKTMDQLERAFFEFAQKIPFYGALIFCGDDSRAKTLLKEFPKTQWSYGFDPKNDYVIQGENSRYQLWFMDHVVGGKKKIGEFQVPVPGRHNALNATAAILAGMQSGFSFEVCQQGLMNFQGVDRRFQLKGQEKDILVFDDYGHHPTEVKATLSAFKEKFPDRRLVVIFQPHRYSRTENCWHEFLKSFDHADAVLVTDIYAAGESAIDGITSERWAKELNHPHKAYLPKSAQITQKILTHLKPGDIFLTLGAGDIWKLGLSVLEDLKHRS